ncbi:uncharacterized protein DUF2505 [Tamaricihabitans halophyticus]|uniref:Uncharacterized protein DUF2505 n=1 Tax=Tamaricihabitans halophyticus TaxID=1262583 RepID=A0A4R2QTC4_9PSEU|nr:DUF2505 domain-containing protein [Tamaricihabitans halophyticus]TCP52967.1 uncharacterized protein DUF2505 [Tamaricihabitans halophyticus]
MASRIEHRTRLDQSPSVVFSVLTAEDYLKARLTALGGDNAALLEYDDSGNYHIRHGVPAEKLPSAARSLLGGDLVVDRKERWISGAEQYANTIEASIPGMPGEIHARMRLRGHASGSELDTEGEVKVGIPIVGAKLERTVAEQVTRLLIAELEFTEKWLNSAS